DGVAQATSSQATITHYESQPGTYTYRGKYNGSETHPPSGLSAPVTVTITRYESAISVAQFTPARAGETHTVSYALSSSSQAGGTISFYVDSVFVSTQTVTRDEWTQFSFTVSPGKHRLFARYSGDELYLPAQSEVTEWATLPSGALAFDVSQFGSALRVSWAASGDAAASFDLYRRVNNVWAYQERYYGGSSAIVPNPVPNTVYVYRVEARDTNGALIATSNVDAALFTTFTDDPLLMAGTKMKAVHVAELVTALNRFRAAFGLAAMAPITNAVAGKRILAADINALRVSLNEARAAAGLGPLQYATLTPKQTLIRAIDLQQLRDGLR
ncbi:MAG TPA: Ig-like domain-containing protein, partial [Thermoanaerobaculia bacterium]